MVVDDRKELLTRAEIMNRVYLRDIAKLDSEIQRLERILAKEVNSSVSTLDDVKIETFNLTRRPLMILSLSPQYSSAIQAEVTQLYAKLEQDQESSAAAVRTTPTTWDLPRYFNKLISRSCVSLCDSHQVNVSSTAVIKGGKCSTAVGWGSTSCLQCKNSAHKRLNGKSCHGGGVKINQSSLVTLLNLAVDNGGYETIYQLVDRSLLLVEDDLQIHRTIKLAQKPVDEPTRNIAIESDEGSTSQEMVVSFQW